MKRCAPLQNIVNLNNLSSVGLDDAAAGASPSCTVSWQTLGDARCGASQLVLVEVGWVGHCGPLVD